MCAMKLSARPIRCPRQHASPRLLQLHAASARQGSLQDEQRAVLQRSLGLVLLLSSGLSSPLGAHAHMLGIGPLQAQVVVCLVLLHTWPDRLSLLVAIQGRVPAQHQHSTPMLQQSHCLALIPGHMRALQSDFMRERDGPSCMHVAATRPLLCRI